MTTVYEVYEKNGNGCAIFLTEEEALSQEIFEETEWAFPNTAKVCLGEKEIEFLETNRYLIL